MLPFLEPAEIKHIEYGQQNLNLSDGLGIRSEICIYLYLNLIEQMSPCSRMNLNYFLKPFSLLLG